MQHQLDKSNCSSARYWDVSIELLYAGSLKLHSLNHKSYFDLGHSVVYFYFCSVSPRKILLTAPPFFPYSLVSQGSVLNTD